MGFLDLFRQPLTPDGFARLYLEYLKRARPSLALRYDSAAFCLRCEGRDALNLHNVFHDYQRVPKPEREALLAKYATIFDAPEVPPSYAEARAQLLPAIRPRALLETVRAGSGGFALAWRTFGPDAVLMLAHDSEHSLSIVSAEQLMEWGVGFDQAMDVALDNLRERTRESFDRLGDGVVQGLWSDAYDSARILLPDLAYRAVGHGTPIVMIPTREHILYAPESSPAAQLALVGFAGQALERSSRRLSTAMYRIEHGVATAWQPPDPAVAISLRRLQLNHLAQDYAEQKAELDREHEITGEDIFVASCMVLDGEGAVPTSLSSWTIGVTASLLPVTDAVAVGRVPEDGGEADMRFLPWSAVAPHGTLTGHYPPRLALGDVPADVFAGAALSLQAALG